MLICDIHDKFAWHRRSNTATQDRISQDKTYQTPTTSWIYIGYRLPTLHHGCQSNLKIPAVLRGHQLSGQSRNSRRLHTIAASIAELLAEAAPLARFNLVFAPAFAPAGLGCRRLGLVVFVICAAHCFNCLLFLYGTGWLLCCG